MAGRLLVTRTGTSSILHRISGSTNASIHYTKESRISTSCQQVKKPSIMVLMALFIHRSMIIMK